MATEKQALGEWGEIHVARNCACPRCKRPRTLKRLRANFKCADLICDFCGFLAQVKTANVPDVAQPPKVVLGAAWKPQQERMAAAIYFPLFMVLKSAKQAAIYYLPTDFQSEALFKPRAPLSAEAKRAGWQGFLYQLDALPEGALVRLA
jgi:type II restriction enzyme